MLLKSYKQFLELCNYMLASFIKYIIAKYKLLKNRILHMEPVLCLQSLYTESDLEVGVPTSAPLSHSAARHKMAVRPKRTHGAPRRNRRLTQVMFVSGMFRLRENIYICD